MMLTGASGDASSPVPRLRRVFGVALGSVGAVALLAMALTLIHVNTSQVHGEAVDRVGRQRLLASMVLTDASALALGRQENAARQSLSTQLGQLIRAHTEISDPQRGILTEVRGVQELRVRLERATRHLDAIRAAVQELQRSDSTPASSGALLSALRSDVGRWTSEMDGINAQLLREMNAARNGSHVVTGLLTIATLVCVWLWVQVPALRTLDTVLEAQRQDHAWRERLAWVARSTTNAVVITDSKSGIQWVNAAYTTLTGYTLAEVKGKRPGSFLHGPDTDAETLARMRAAVVRGEGFKERIANYAKDGRRYWVLIDCQPLRNEAGGLDGFLSVQSELTELLDLKHALTKQAARHRLAVTAAAMSVWEWDVASDRLEYDDNHFALFGLDRGGPSETLHWREYVEPEDRALVESSLTRALRDEGAYAAEFRIRHGHGGIRWFRGSGVVIRDITGRIERMIGVSMDVTDSRLAAELRHEADARVRSLAANLPGVLFELRLEAGGSLSFPYASDGMKTLLGIEPDAAQHDGAVVFNAMHSDDLPAVRAGLKASSRTLAAWTHEFRVVLPHGETRWLRSHATPVRQSDGTTIWSGVMLDSTPIKQAELRERETAASLAEAQTLARLGSWSFDLSTQRVEWSPQMYVLFGRDPTLGPPDYPTAISYYVEPDGAWLRSAIQRAIEHGAPYQGVLRLHTPVAGVAVVRAQAKVTMDAAGKATRIFGTVVDITAMVEREEALQRAQARAEAASQAKSVFLANMSHEIRTPMAAILGYLELLADQEVSRAQSLEYTAILQRNAKHLLELINQVLDLSKIEAGQMQTERVACAPTTLVREVASLLRPHAAEKGLDLRVEFRYPLPSTIQTDPTRLRQILLNLVGNAIKFTERGAVTISVGVVHGPPRPQLELRIQDTGIGIEPGVLANLFRPFTQADSSTTRRFGGTGLGLSIASHLCRLLGGSIEAESVIGAGTLFIARVDVGDLEGVGLLEAQTDVEESTSAAPHAVEPSNATPLRGLRVLLVEDGIDNQRLISLHVGRAGAIVETLSNGQLAVERLTDASKPKCDVVLMDMQMPVLDGYGAAAALRKRGYTGPIIALTAHALEGERKRCLDAGCDDYMTKPVDRRGLVATISAHAKARGDEALSSATLTAQTVKAPIFSRFQDDPEMIDLIAEFVKSLPLRIAQFESALATGDLKRLRTLAHQLKGAGGGYGFDPISQASEVVEQYVVGGAPTEQLKTSVAHLVSICAAVQSAPRQSVPPIAAAAQGRISWRARS